MRTPSPVGSTPTVRQNANPQVASVAEAVRSGEHPERLTPLLSPPAFDPEAYARDPKSWLDVVEPGRVFQSRRPAADVPVIVPAGSTHHEVTQGERVDLMVKVPAGAPVVFHSFNLGLFDNGLTTFNVAADDSGVARARFHAARGTVDDITILASSPMCSGRVEFLVFVALHEVASP